MRSQLGGMIVSDVNRFVAIVPLLAYVLHCLQANLKLFWKKWQILQIQTLFPRTNQKKVLKKLMNEQDAILTY